MEEDYNDLEENEPGDLDSEESEEDQDLDLGDLTSRHPLNDPDFKTLTTEILEDLIDYVNTQGTVSDSEIRSIIDDYVFDKMERGELDPDMVTPEKKDMIFEEWRKKKDELLYAEDEDEF